MLYVPFYIEALRSRPVLLFWVAALAQAAVWIAVPMLFYGAPPGDVAQVLAVGHEFQFDSDVGPPLAFWLAEIAFRIGGIFGVYALSQICVIVTYWCIFTLGSAMLGPAHAVLAVLLMVGISLFTVPTPDFGPPVLTMALWAAALLIYWRAVARGQRRSWYALGAAAALLLLTSEAALILLGTLALFTALTERGRAAFATINPWVIAVLLAGFLSLHLLWLEGAGDSLTPTLQKLHEAAAARQNTAAWLRLLAALVLAHAGLFILAGLASGWPRVMAGPVPTIMRPPVDPFAVTFVKVFALVPALAATICSVLLGRSLPIGGAAPLVVLSGLALVMAAGNSIALFHQRILGFAWAGLLIVPALFVPFLIVALPWTVGADLEVAQPASAIGRFFAENFQRRTGRPLAIVGGEAPTAALVALGAPSRPSVFFDADPARSPWVTADDIRKKGAVVVWLTADTTPTPPPAIKAVFPDLVPEVPRTFDRPVQGRLPVLRVGWGVIRPQSQAAAAAAPIH
jgi:hypothetical protein